MTVPDKLTSILKAREIIRSLDIEDSSEIDIEAIAMEKGAIVREGSLKGAEGRLSVLGPQALITVKSDIPEVGKKRFIIAHELGHFELHQAKFLTVSCLDSDFSEWGKNKAIEVEANYFAAELLMPEHIFKRKIEDKTLSKSMIEVLSKEFQTSLTATSIRFVTLRSEYALVCSEKSLIKWYVIGEEFPYNLNVRGQLHPNSVAYDFFKGHSLPDRFLPVSMDAWIDDFKFNINDKVMEMAIALPAYSQVLSFIYVESNEDSDYEKDDYYKELDGRLKFH
jgi:Zn-dependent peptidase ImmA (M78 family)